MTTKDSPRITTICGQSGGLRLSPMCVIGTNIPLPWKLSISPFIMAQSGTPYNITTGLDPLGIGIATARPALLANRSAASCTGAHLVYEAAFGCFDLEPSAGEQIISRNYGRGPGMVNINLRLSR